MPSGIPYISPIASTESEPIPYDVDSYFNAATKDIPIQEVPDQLNWFAESLYEFTRPFLAQGFNSVATLNKGMAGFYAHLDSAADFVAESTGAEQGGLFEKLAQIASDDSVRWAKAAEEVGIGFFDEMVSEAVGGFVPGVTQFVLDVGSGYTLPYMAGAAEAEEGESPFAAGMVAAAKTATLDKLFKMMHPLKTYLKAPAMGTVFGLEEAAVAPEGQQAKGFAKGFGIGAMYSTVSPGGHYGLNEVKAATKLAIDNIKRVPVGEFARAKLAEERGSVIKGDKTGLFDRDENGDILVYQGRVKGQPGSKSHHFTFTRERAENFANVPTKEGERVVDVYRAKDFPESTFIKAGEESPTSVEDYAKYHQDLGYIKPEDLKPIKTLRLSDTSGGDATVFDPQKRQRKFLKSVQQVSEIDAEAAARVREIDPQEYFIEPNVESVAKAKTRIEKEGIGKANEYLESDAPAGAEKGATFYLMIKDAQKRGDYDREVELIEMADVQLREAGRFVQSASLWSKMGSPNGFIRWANKELAGVAKKYNFTDSWMNRKPTEFYLNKKETEIVYESFREIRKMDNEIDRADATLELIDMVAQKVPPSNSEMIDAYRYQNMLSGPRTQFRNIGENLGNTFLSRPIDIATMGGIDFVKSSLTGKARENYVKDVAVYYKTAINAVPNAAQGFMAVMRGKQNVRLEKPDIGIEARTEFQAARAKQLPKGLTLVGRFMEASDAFNSSIIGAGEMARLMKNGVPEAEAYAQAHELAQMYLYRNRFESGDPRLSKFSQTLNSLGKNIENLRTLPGTKLMTKWFVPFVRTPVNKGISMVEHSPLGFLGGDFKSNEKLAKNLSGSIVTALFTAMAMNGETTWLAPTNPDEKQLFYASGRRQFSFAVPLPGGGQAFIPIWFLGPYALAAALPMAAKYYAVDQSYAVTKDYADKTLELAGGIAQFVGSQSSTQSIGTLFSMMSGDIDYSTVSAFSFTTQQMIPAGALIRFTNTIIDPVFRKKTGFMEGIYANLPVLSQSLEAYLDPEGTEATRKSVNYFLPYDVGYGGDKFEKGYQREKREEKAKAAERAMNRFGREYSAGNITLQEALEGQAGIRKKTSKQRSTKRSIHKKPPKNKSSETH